MAKTCRNNIDNNNYIKILDFLERYGNASYQKPESAPNQAKKDELCMLKIRAQEVSEMMRKMCNSIASHFNLTLSSPIRWLIPNGQRIKRYFWGQLKQSGTNSSISISIFAERNLFSKQYQYRIGLELNEHNTREVDYQAYKRYAERPINTPLIKFYARPNPQINQWYILDISQYEVSNRMNGSNNIFERVQPSYFVSRIDDKTNSDKTADKFQQQFLEGIALLLPYYTHVMNSYRSEIISSHIG